MTDSTSAVDVIKGDAPRVVRSLALAERRFDLVFFDPPYDSTAEMVAATAKSLPTVCAPDARVILELATRHEPIVEAAAEAWGAEVELQRTYGDTVVAILRLDGCPMEDPGAEVVAGSDGD